MKTFKVIGRDIQTNNRINGIGFKNYGDKITIITEDGNEVQISENSLRILKDDVLEEFINKPITTYHVYELHNVVMRAIIDFLRNKNIKDIDEIQFQADGLKESIERGNWCAYTDSSITLYGYENNERKIAGYSI